MNGQTVIVSVKGAHNHPVIIKRNKHSKRRENRALRNRETQSYTAKDESMSDAQFLLMEPDEDDENNM